MGGRVKSNESEHALTNANKKGNSINPATIIVPVCKDCSTGLFVIASCQDGDGGHDESDDRQPETGDLRPRQLLGEQSDQDRRQDRKSHVNEVDLPLRGREVWVVYSGHCGDGLCTEDARTGCEHPPGKDTHPADCVRHGGPVSWGRYHEREAKRQVSHDSNHLLGSLYWYCPPEVG